MGHRHPDVPRNYDMPAVLRRDYDNVCPQCEAVEGRYEARHHARQMWNLSMRAHAHVVEECRKTIAAINPGYKPALHYSIGQGGYTVLEPKKTHQAMLQAFTDQDALCLLELGGAILTCPEYQIGDYRVSENCAIWCALMRHVECSKMNRQAVARIVDTGVTLTKQQWQTWQTDLVSQHLSFLIARPVTKVTPRKPRMSALGLYFSTNLTRSVAQAPSSGSSQASAAKRAKTMASTPIPGTPERDGDGDF
jgi:hypothetical protein